MQPKLLIINTRWYFNHFLKVLRWRLKNDMVHAAIAFPADSNYCMPFTFGSNQICADNHDQGQKW